MTDVSVIIPCYNQARWLAQAITSVRRQTRQPREIIVVDDGSTDNTSAVANNLGVLLIKQPHAGISAARNAGIEIALGDYILPLDADDLLHPKFIERTLNRDNIVGTHVRSFGNYNSTWRPTLLHPTHKDMITTNCIMVTSLYHITVWETTGGYDPELKYAEDWDFWLRAAANGFTVTIVPEVLFFYRQHGPSTSNISIARRHELMNALRAKHGEEIGMIPIPTYSLITEDDL